MQVRYGFPTRGIKVIGVTGTDGKTTTATMIHGLLTEAGFIDVALRPVGMPMLASVITARKSKIGVNQT